MPDRTADSDATASRGGKLRIDPNAERSRHLEALRDVQEPELGRDIVTLNMVKDVVISDADVSLKIELTTPACPLKDEIERNVQLEPWPAIGVERSGDHLGRDGPPRTARAGAAAAAGRQEHHRRRVRQGRRGQDHRVSANLAVALAMEGATVGLLDADITGPNIPLMLGVEGAPTATAEGKITPLERYGVKVICIQFFVPEGQPIVWRGPLVGGAIQQFLRDVDWGELDYLVIDLPPGTSDAQLTLAQAVPISGALLVTTPQDVAVLDVAKALAMFRRMSVPVMGIVENMSYFICPHCGEADRDLRPRRRRALRGAQRARVFRRHPDRRQGAPGRRRGRACGCPA